MLSLEVRWGQTRYSLGPGYVIPLCPPERLPSLSPVESTPPSHYPILLNTTACCIAFHRAISHFISSPFLKSTHPVFMAMTSPISASAPLVHPVHPFFRHHPLLLVSLLLLLFSLFSLTSACETDWDCSLGGVCSPVTSTCFCDVWWTGPQCQYLRLQPAARQNGLNLAVNTSTWKALTSPANTSLAIHSWCFSMLRDAQSNDYVAVASYIISHCTLDEWMTNSEVVTVRAPTPFSPFKTSTLSVALPPWAHNPKILQYEGLWLLFFIGNPTPHPPTPVNCTQGKRQYPPLSVDPGNNGSRVAYATSSTGPWTLWNDGAPLFSPNPNVWYSNTVSNPAPLILPNGTVLFYFTAATDTVRGPHTGNVIAVARADHWKGPYTVLSTGGLTYPDAEDPVVFRDPRGNFHLLCNTNTGHWMTGNLTGHYTGHAWSRDGVTWSDQSLGSVTTTVHFDDGSTTEFSYRERPDLLLDAQGRPIALSTGMSGVDGYWDSFSFVQPICTCSSNTQLCYGGTAAPTPCGALTSSE